MMAVAGRLKVVAFDLIRMVVMDDDLVLVPVEADRAAVTNNRCTPRRRAATGVEVLGIDRVDARFVHDQRARRVVVTGIDGEAAKPVVWLDRLGNALAVEQIERTLR